MYRNNLCGQISALLEQYADNELSIEQQNFVENHLQYCELCKEQLAVLKEIDEMVRGISVPDPVPEFWVNQRESILQNINTDTQVPRERGILGSGNSKLFLPIITAAAAVLLFFTMVEDTQIQQDISSYESPEITALEPLTEQAEQVPEENIEISTPDIQSQSTASSNPAREEPQNVAVIAVVIPVEEEPEVDAMTDAAVPADIQPKEKEVTEIPPENSEEVELTRPVARISANSKDIASGFNTDRSSAGTSSVLKVSPAIVLPDEDNEEFESYIQNKRIISMVENPYERIAGWNKFLENIEGRITIDLVINDIYDIYNKNISSASLPEIKKNALEFVSMNKDVLVIRMGESRYDSVLKYLKSIQN